MFSDRLQMLRKWGKIEKSSQLSLKEMFVSNTSNNQGVSRQLNI
jgi:hypothetical protein